MNSGDTGTPPAPEEVRVPYGSIAEAKAAGARTSLGGVGLSLAQVNAMAAQADSIKAKGGAENAWAVATANFKKSHHIEKDRWVANKTEAEQPEDAELSREFLEYEHEDTEETIEFGELETETVPGLQIAMVGKHTDKHGRVWEATEEELDALVTSYPELKKRGWLARLRFAEHDNWPENLKALGLVSLGYLDNVRRVGTRLFADAMKVPKQVAELMRSGALPTVSPGIASALKVGDYTARRGLHHLALLGWKPPAMPGLKGVDAITAMYAGDTSGVSMWTTETGGWTQAAWTNDKWDIVPEKTGEFDMVFELIGDLQLAGDAGNGERDSSAEGGEMELNELLEKHGCKTVEELEQKMADTAKKAAEADGADDAKTELEALKAEMTEGKVAAFEESISEKVTVPQRTKLLGAFRALVEFDDGHEGGVLEFEQDEKKVSTTPLADFTEVMVELSEKLPDISSEEGKQTHTAPGDGKTKPGSKDDVMELEDGTQVVGSLAAQDVEKRAAELLKGQRDAGNAEYSEADAYEDALLEMSAAESE